MNCNLPGSSAHGIFQARILEWAAVSFSRGFSPPRYQTRVSCIAGWFFTIWVPRDVVQFSLVSQSCLTLCNSMDCSMPGLPVPHQLPELAQTRVHQISDAIQPPHTLLSPSPPAFNLSQHQGLFKWVSSSNQLPKVLEFHLQLSGSRWVIIPSWLSALRRSSLYSSVYSCHLLISSSVRSMPFLSCIVPIFPWNVLIFLKRSLVFPNSIVFLYLFALITEEGFLISPCYSLELCIQMGISFPFSFAFHFSSFHSSL